MRGKKLTRILLALAGLLTLSGCSFLDDLINSLDPENQDYFGPSIGKSETYESEGASTIDRDSDGKTSIGYTYKDAYKHNVYPVDACPTVGQPKLLIVPIWFTDSSSIISYDKREDIRNDIELAYLGTSEETGWESVKSYYYKESNGLLDLQGVVTDWYDTGEPSSNYEHSIHGANRTTDLVNEVVDDYFRKNPSMKRTDFDYDKNGYLDGVMLIYAYPDYSAMGNEESNNFWAYCFWVQESQYYSKTNPGANTFFWASYDFMYSKGSKSTSKTGKLLSRDYASGDTSHCNVDAHTYIHEMGHVFGLDDYYDYGKNSYSPAGGFSMQDHNIGGHDPYSVMALGWAKPYIVDDSTTLTIGTFQKTHDLILITPRWNKYNSPFDEYILLELYSPTGLNQFDSTYRYNNSTEGVSATGIRMWHVDARFAFCDKTYVEDNIEKPVFFINKLTTNPNNGRYGVKHAFSNTFTPCESDEYYGATGEKYSDYSILQLIRNRASASYKTDRTISNSDLFTSSSLTYHLSDFHRQFAASSTLNNGGTLDWVFKININGHGNDATAEIEITKN